MDKIAWTQSYISHGVIWRLKLSIVKAYYPYEKNQQYWSNDQWCKKTDTKGLMEIETKTSFTRITKMVSRYEFNRDIIFYDIIALLGWSTFFHVEQVWNCHINLINECTERYLIPRIWCICVILSKIDRLIH